MKYTYRYTGEKNDCMCLDACHTEESTSCMFTFSFQAFAVFVTCNTYKAVNDGKAWGVVCNWAPPPALFFGVCVCLELPRPPV